MNMSVEQRTHIAELIMSAEGRNALAASLAQPLQQRLDYNGIARRIFDVQPLPAGALPIYDNAVSQSELLESGQMANIWGAEIITSRPIGARRVTIPMFEIGSNPTIPLQQLRERRFNLIDRTNEEHIDNEYDLLQLRKKIKQDRIARKEFKLKYKRLKKAKNKLRFICQN